jgi:hypothetical protein
MSLLGTYAVVLFSQKITLQKGTGMDVGDVFSVMRTRQLNIFFSSAGSPKLYGQPFR